MGSERNGNGEGRESGKRKFEDCILGQFSVLSRGGISIIHGKRGDVNHG